MLTQNSTKTARPASAGVKPVWYQSARSLRNLFADRSARSLNRRYLLAEVLLSEGQYVRYQAYDSIGTRDCSVKMLSSTVTDKAAGERQLLHEAEILGRLDHANIAALYECSRDDQGNPFSVMEPLKGRDLHSLLAEVSQLPLGPTVEILRGVGAALQHAHERGIVHADINPHCVFLQEEISGTVPTTEAVKVLNFGLARQLNADKPETQRNPYLDLIFDAPAYLAPEELELSGQAVDDRADQWSLAVLAYQMLSGQLPFHSDDSWCLRALIRGPEAPESLAALVPGLPAQVIAAIAKALSKDKHQRFDSVANFIRALEGVTAATSRPTQPEVRVDLIEQCRPASDRSAAPTALPTATKTREYPVPSFPAELLAAAEKADAQLPAPRPTPPWTGSEVIPPRRGAVPQLWLVLCILMALIPAATVLHFLHPVARARAMFHHRPTQSAPLLPSVSTAAAALPGPIVSPLGPPCAVVAAQSVATKPQHAHSHHGRTRASTKRHTQNAYRSASHSPAIQDALAAGLGL